jgi:hypothetical protein
LFSGAKFTGAALFLRARAKSSVRLSTVLIWALPPGLASLLRLAERMTIYTLGEFPI